MRREIINPLIRQVYKYFGSFQKRMDFDCFVEPKYSYAMYCAALQAKALNFNKISAIEFSVASGKGIKSMCLIAEAIKNHVGINIEIVGFDTLDGLPASKNYKDLQYVWTKGLFKSNLIEFEQNTKNAKIYIGDVGVTIFNFLENLKNQNSPIGFISFDLDYYSSTVKAFEVLKFNDNLFLPRAYLYFDDITGIDEELHCEYVGELSAIREFNEISEFKKICRINNLNWKRKIDSLWNNHLYVFHLFNHKLYNIDIASNKHFAL